MLYALCFILFIVGLYCVLVKKNMIKIVIGLLVMEYAVNLFLIMLGYHAGTPDATGVAPIVDKTFLVTNTQVSADFIARSVDPLPQALVLTAIVISLGSLALTVSICIRAYEKYGTFDITHIRRLKG